MLRNGRTAWLILLLVLGSAAQETSQAGSRFQLPVCSKPSRGEKLVGWGKYGLHFVVATHELNLLLGKVDVDYVRHVVTPKGGSSVLELWFGGNALAPLTGLQASDGPFGVKQAEIIDSAGVVVGLDSRGTRQESGHWRTFVVHREGAKYENVTPQDAALFDRVIDSACQVPDPENEVT